MLLEVSATESRQRHEAFVAGEAAPELTEAQRAEIEARPHPRTRMSHSGTKRRLLCSTLQEYDCL